MFTDVSVTIKNYFSAGFSPVLSSIWQMVKLPFNYFWPFGQAQSSTTVVDPSTGAFQKTSVDLIHPFEEQKLPQDTVVQSNIKTIKGSADPLNDSTQNTVVENNIKKIEGSGDPLNGSKVTTIISMEITEEIIEKKILYNNSQQESVVEKQEKAINSSFLNPYEDCLHKDYEHIAKQLNQNTKNLNEQKLEESVINSINKVIPVERQENYNLIKGEEINILEKNTIDIVNQQDSIVMNNNSPTNSMENNKDLYIEFIIDAKSDYKIRRYMIEWLWQFKEKQFYNYYKNIQDQPLILEITGKKSLKDCNLLNITLNDKCLPFIRFGIDQRTYMEWPTLEKIRLHEEALWKELQYIEVLLQKEKCECIDVFNTPLNNKLLSEALKEKYLEYDSKSFKVDNDLEEYMLKPKKYLSNTFNRNYFNNALKIYKLKLQEFHYRENDIEKRPFLNYCLQSRKDPNADYICPLYISSPGHEMDSNGINSKLYFHCKKGFGPYLAAYEFAYIKQADSTFNEKYLLENGFLPKNLKCQSSIKTVLNESKIDLVSSKGKSPLFREINTTPKGGLLYDPIGLTLPKIEFFPKANTNADNSIILFDKNDDKFNNKLGFNMGVSNTSEVELPSLKGRTPSSNFKPLPEGKIPSTGLNEDLTETKQTKLNSNDNNTVKKDNMFSNKNNKKGKQLFPKKRR